MRTTDKLERIALQSKFNDEQIDVLLEVVNATENPQIAIELLLGIYEEPYIAKCVDHPQKGILTFTEYDKIKDKVYYSYQKKKTKSIYVDKNVDESIIDVFNYEPYSKVYSKDVKTIWITLDEWETVNDHCYYSTWIQYPEVLV